MQQNPQQQQQQQQRRGNAPRMPLMYSNSLPPNALMPGPPPVRYGGPTNYQQQIQPGGGTKHHQRGGGNRNSRGGSIQPHRQQRPIPGSRYHPYPFRQPLPPQQRFYRPAQMAPRTPAALMGTPPGMSQSEYEPIHSAQVQRDKEKLVRQGNVLAPSNTTQFLIRDHNRQTTPSSIATPTPTNEESPSNSQTNPTNSSYDQMFDIGDVDVQSDDTESNQDLAFVGGDPALDSDFNDIYYQCRYERYAAFSRANLLNEVLSLCANIDRLQHEKSEVEKRLRDAQQHILELTSTNGTSTQNSSNGTEDRSTNDEILDNHTRIDSPPLADRTELTPVVDEDDQTSTSSQPMAVEQQEILPNPVVEDPPIERREQEQEIVHD